MVRATFAGFSTAFSALQANQKRLDITGQNLSNMNTPGYTRQQLETSSLHYTNPVSKYMCSPELTVGFGTRMDCISQIRDPYLDAQYRTQMEKAGYTDSIQTSLDSLSKWLDESDIESVHQAFLNIKSTLENMQDPAKVNDPVMESELRSRMQALTNLLNDTSNNISEAEKEEFERLEGARTNENGAVQEVNDMLRQIGDLNVQIKRNQIYGQPSLELMDDRNNLLDQLASYIPIEVTYYKDAEHSGTYTVDGQTRNRMYEYDSNGNVIGKKDWPDDLRVEMLYSDKNGKTQRLTLVNGTEGGQSHNYGSIAIKNGTSDSPLGTTMQFSGFTNTGAVSDVEIGGYNSSVTADKQTYNSFTGGSIQASLDMLQADGNGGRTGIKGYQYYQYRLDTVADAFSAVMNEINKKHDNGTAADTDLLTGNGAADITVNPDWYSGTVHISTGKTGDDRTDSILDMLEAMKITYSGDSIKLGDNTLTVKPDLEKKSFADYMNNTSTLLANDSLNNSTSFETNVKVLNGIQDGRDSVSGVNLDEEAANMMTYLSAYNAASRLITTLDEALNTLINNTGLVGR